LGGLGFLIYRMIRPRPERKGRRPSKPPVIPVVPPVRLAKIWLTEGTSGKGRLLPDHEHLMAGTPYSLHLQIQPRGAEGQADEASQAESGEGEKTKLNVVFFSPETDFELERKTETLNLPRRGASNEIHRPIKPLQAGQHRIRACIYYGNVLLQSALMEATVAQRGARVAAAGPGQGAAAIARTVDYVASTDLVSLEELPQPALNIFTNQTSDASHWIGVFAASEPSGFQLRSGDIHIFGPGDLAERARTLRKLLTKIEGERAYNLAAPPPLSQREQEWRAKDLVDLAVAGWKLYHHLFLSRKDRSEIEQMQSFRAALQAPGIVSVARCRRDNATIPWAALYNLYLDTGKQDEIKLCGVFKDQLAANVWSVDQAVLVEKHDLLDNPQACRSQPQCPLADPRLRKLTVCPSGFWGFLHQVEQPLQQVTPTPVDQVPGEMKVCRFDQTSFLMSAHDDAVKMAAGVCPDIPDAEQHHAELTALSQSTRLKLVWEKDRDQVLELLEQGGHHFYYFYCHGEQEENEFKLKLGPSTSPGYITSDNLDPSEIKWPSQPQPLVILNGCETMALTPELIHDFLGTLRLLGASGIVGTEIKVWTQLARPFGCLVLRHLLHGKSVGEAFLEVRRYFMRQYNPLGLVYTLHAPAPLHLHDPSDCDWCRSHLPAHASGGSG
jgi:hypothetical protein